MVSPSKGKIISSIVGIAIAIAIFLAMSSTSSSGTARYQVETTHVEVVAPSVVAVAFKVHNVGNGPGVPRCTVDVSASASVRGVHAVALGAIKPGGWAYEPAAQDKVTMSGTGPVNPNGGVVVKCA